MTDRRVAVTGASGYLARGLIERLDREPTIDRVLAIDVRPLEKRFSGKVVFHKRDVTEPLYDLFGEYEIDSVVHLAFILNPGRRRKAARRINVGGTANVIDACIKANVPYMLYLSSTSVYGAYSDMPELIGEDLPVRPLRGFQYSEDKARAESLILEAMQERSDFASTILRVCPVMGAHSDNFISEAFSKPFLVAFHGCDPPMQLIHENDMTEAMWQCIVKQIPGVYNLAPESTVRWSEMARMFGRKLISIPAPILYGVVNLSWLFRLQSDSPPSGLNFIRYPRNVSTKKIRRALGIAPEHTSHEAWQAFVDREHRSLLAKKA